MNESVLPKDGENGICVPSPGMKPEEKAAAQPQAPVLGRQGIVLLVLSLAASLWYVFGHRAGLHGPGIGLTVCQWGLTAAALLCAQRSGTLQARSLKAWLMFAAALALGAVHAVHANNVMRLLDLPVVSFTTALSLFALTGQNTSDPLSGEGLWEGLRRFLSSLVCHVPAPFRAMTQKRIHSPGRIICGIACALVTGILAILLLGSADEIFSRMIGDLFSGISGTNGSGAFRMVLAVGIALVLFSHLFTLQREPKHIVRTDLKKSDPVIVLFVLSAMALVYALFAYVQVRYLFLGAESARMSGGYAVYARSGFFQLVLVALLTLCVILPALTLCGEKRALRALCAVVAILTAVIDVSAFLRMKLYTDAYGLTTLRIVTFWGIGMILLALLAALARSLRPGMRICRMLAVTALCTWLVLNYVNIDALVADHLVRRYNRGEADFAAVESLMSSWSPSYYAAFERIEDPDARAKAIDLLDRTGFPKDRPDAAPGRPAAFDWSFDYARIN